MFVLKPVISGVKWLFAPPFANELRSPSAQHWLVGVRIMVLIVGPLDATCWAYYASTLFTSLIPSVLAAVCAWVVMFLAISVTDLMVLNADLKGESLVDPTSKSGKDKKFIAGLVIRGLIATIAIYLLTPILALLVFNGSIKNKLVEENNNKIEIKRQQLSEGHNEQIKILEDVINGKEVLLKKEFVGANDSISRKGGNGYVAKQLQKEIAEHKTNLEKLKQQNKEDLERFNLAYRQHDEKILGEYGITLLDKSIVGRQGALDLIAADPKLGRSYQWTLWTIKGFIIILLVSLIACKIFQPQPDVDIYLSTLLQSKYQEYLAGRYNKILKPHVRPGSYTITPQGFMNLVKGILMLNKLNQMMKKKELLEEKASKLQSQEVQKKKEITYPINEDRKVLRTIESQIEASKKICNQKSAEIEATKARVTNNQNLQQGEAVKVATSLSLAHKMITTERKENMLELQSIIASDELLLKSQQEEFDELNANLASLTQQAQDVRDNIVLLEAPLLRIRKQLFECETEIEELDREIINLESDLSDEGNSDVIVDKTHHEFIF